MAGLVKAIGRHGVRSGPMENIETVTMSIADGVEGNVRPSRPSKVTVVSDEGWAAACAELGAELPWTFRRADLLFHGEALTGSKRGVPCAVAAGGELAFGDAVLLVAAGLRRRRPGRSDAAATWLTLP